MDFGMISSKINNNFTQYRQHQQAVSKKGFKSFIIFKHSCIKVEVL